MSKEIVLSNGMIATVDDDDYALVAHYKWHAHRERHTVYAVTSGAKIRMHRLILDIVETPQAIGDHIDRNGLNNQRKNLRVLDNADNHWNHNKYVKATSRFKGVCFHKAARKWQASVGGGVNRQYVGLFGEECDAATAYNFAVEEMGHGELASFNHL